MSEIERTIAEELAKVPVAVREKFLLMAQGAAVAVECAREAAAAAEGSPHQSASLTASPRGSQDAEAEDGGAA